MVCSSIIDPTTMEPTNILDYTTSKDTITLDLTSSLENMNQVNDSEFPVDTSTSPIRLKLQSLTATSMDPNLLKTTMNLNSMGPSDTKSTEPTTFSLDQEEPASI